MTFWASTLEFAKTYSTGVIAASISTIFASYMLINGRFTPDPISVTVRHQPVTSPLAGRIKMMTVRKQPPTANPQGVPFDEIETGSIPNIGFQRQTVGKKEDMRPILPSRLDALKYNYSIRIATSEIALLEGGGRIWNVRRGSLLPGAGRVLEIKKEKTSWVVVTTVKKIR